VTPASFEPSIDYVVTKIPRFAFREVPGAEPYLTTSMKSVGEVMAVGRNFAESIQKALRGLETGLTGFDEVEIPGAEDEDPAAVRGAVIRALGMPTPDRLRVIAQAFRHGLTVEEIEAACSYEPWFLRQIEEIVRVEARVRREGLPEADEGDEPGAQAAR
jgi:carbamoyl-phosphate synthase large subunit